MTERVDDRSLEVARVYALSLLGLAEEAGSADDLLEELRELAAAVEADVELGDFFASPLADTEERRQVLERALRGKLTDLLVDGLQVMSRKGRLDLVPTLAVAYRQELDRLRGRVDVEVTTAVALSNELRQRLSSALERATGKAPRLSERVEPGILGGMIVAIGDRKVDYSLATDLRQLDDRLRERAAAEIHGAMSEVTR